MLKKLLKPVPAICLSLLLSIQLQAQFVELCEGLNGKKINSAQQAKTKPITNGIHPVNRTIDGSNNNLTAQGGTHWGSTDIALFREMPAMYGITDQNNAMSGGDRPSARKISNVLCDEPKTNFSSRNLSAFVYVWGQFIDHDMVLTPTGTTEYLPVLLPSDEPLFNVDIPFFRSAVLTSTGVKNKREQINQNTSWIDASVVYGSDDERASWLRTKKQGKLKTSAGNLLPWNTLTGEKDSPIDITAPDMANDANHTVKTFVAGDIRAVEHPGITALHTIFVREHNNICNRLIALGLKNDEEIYQKARKEVGALIQAVTYEEFLPALGVTLSDYVNYKNTAGPDIMNTFATASFRIGHTMVADELALRTNDCQVAGPGSLELSDVFFNPDLISDFGTDVFLKGLSTHKQYETDTKINGILRNYLFGNPADSIKFGLDLAALNIQRGRDHGLPDYNSVRKFYTGFGITSFSQITLDPVKAAALQSLYGNVNNIDLWVGLLAEDRLSGKSVGKTMHAMLKAQFEKLRDGDYYYYIIDQAMPAEIRFKIKATKLSEVIKRNTSLTNLQQNLFFISPCPGENGEGLIANTSNFDESQNKTSSNSDNNHSLISSSNQNELKYFPNPVSDVLYVNLENLNEQNTISIYSHNGILLKRVLAEVGVDGIQMDVTDLPCGIYILNLKNEKINTSYKLFKK